MALRVGTASRPRGSDVTARPPHRPEIIYVRLSCLEIRKHEWHALATLITESECTEPPCASDTIRTCDASLRFAWSEEGWICIAVAHGAHARVVEIAKAKEDACAAATQKLFRVLFGKKN